MAIIFPFGTVFGRYTIGDLLGSGVVSEVYEATTADGAVVAIKVLKAGAPPHAKREARLEQEGIALAELVHVNVAGFREEGAVEGRVYLAMERVYGIDLRRLTAEEGLLPLARVVRIAYQAAEGLAAVHERGFLHRDVKPENILVTPDDSRETDRLRVGLGRQVRGQDDAGAGPHLDALHVARAPARAPGRARERRVCARPRPLRAGRRHSPAGPASRAGDGALRAPPRVRPAGAPHALVRRSPHPARPVGCRRPDDGQGACEPAPVERARRHAPRAAPAAPGAAPRGCGRVDPRPHGADEGSRGRGVPPRRPPSIRARALARIDWTRRDDPDGGRRPGARLGRRVGQHWRAPARRRAPPPDPGGAGRCHARGAPPAGAARGFHQNPGASGDGTGSRRGDASIARSGHDADAGGGHAGHDGGRPAAIDGGARGAGGEPAEHGTAPAAEIRSPSPAPCWGSGRRARDGSWRDPTVEARRRRHGPRSGRGDPRGPLRPPRCRRPPRPPPAPPPRRRHGHARRRGGARSRDPDVRPGARPQPLTRRKPPMPASDSTPPPAIDKHRALANQILRAAPRARRGAARGAEGRAPRVGAGFSCRRCSWC